MPLWTADEDEKMRELYPTTKVAALAKILGRTPRAVGARAQFLGVKWAGGGPCWVPIGTERWLKQRNLMIRKVADTGDQNKDWKQVCVIEWEEINGPVPGGMVLCVQNKRRPRALDNLVLLTKEEQPKVMAQEPLGWETVRPMDGRLYRKVAMTGGFKVCWKRVDMLEWEKVHGPIPEGYRLGRMDLKGPDTLKNHALFTEAEYFERMGMSGMPALPKELQEIAHLKAAITKQIKKMARASTPQ